MPFYREQIIPVATKSFVNSNESAEKNVYLLGLNPLQIPDVEFRQRRELLLSPSSICPSTPYIISKFFRIGSSVP